MNKSVNFYNTCGKLVGNFTFRERMIVPVKAYPLRAFELTAIGAASEFRFDLIQSVSRLVGATGRL